MKLLLPIIILSLVLVGCTNKYTCPEGTIGRYDDWYSYDCRTPQEWEESINKWNAAEQLENECWKEREECEYGCADNYNISIQDCVDRCEIKQGRCLR